MIFLEIAKIYLKTRVTLLGYTGVFKKNFRFPDLSPVKQTVSFNQALSDLEKLLASPIQN